MMLVSDDDNVLNNVNDGMEIALERAKVLKNYMSDLLNYAKNKAKLGFFISNFYLFSASFFQVLSLPNRNSYFFILCYSFFSQKTFTIQAAKKVTTTIFSTVYCIYNLCFFEIHFLIDMVKKVSSLPRI